MKRQTGQSSAEFAVAASVLVLMVLGTWTIATYQEIQRRGIVAARQAAFEGSWVAGRTSDSVLMQRLASLHFDDAGLVNAVGSGRMADRESASLDIQSGAAPGRGSTAVNFLMTPLRVAGGFLGGGFDLGNRGFVAGTVRMRTNPVDSLPAPFRAMQLEFQQPFALLSDAWNAAGPGHVRQRAGGLAPAHALSPLTGLWRALAIPLGLIEPSLRQLCPGLIEPDRIPEDRLGPGTSPLPADCP